MVSILTGNFETAKIAKSAMSDDMTGPIILLTTPLIFLAEVFQKLISIGICLFIIIVMWLIYFALIRKKEKQKEEIHMENDNVITLDKIEHTNQLNELDNKSDSKLNYISIVLPILTGLLITICIFLRLF